MSFELGILFLLLLYKIQSLEMKYKQGDQRLTKFTEIWPTENKAPPNYLVISENPAWLPVYNVKVEEKEDAFKTLCYKTGAYEQLIKPINTKGIYCWTEDKKQLKMFKVEEDKCWSSQKNYNIDTDVSSMEGIFKIPEVLEFVFYKETTSFFIIKIFKIEGSKLTQMAEIETRKDCPFKFTQNMKISFVNYGTVGKMLVAFNSPSFKDKITENKVAEFNKCVFIYNLQSKSANILDLNKAEAVATGVETKMSKVYEIHDLILYENPADINKIWIIFSVKLIIQKEIKSFYELLSCRFASNYIQLDFCSLKEGFQVIDGATFLGSYDLKGQKKELIYLNFQKPTSELNWGFLELSGILGVEKLTNIRKQTIIRGIGNRNLNLEQASLNGASTFHLDLRDDADNMILTSRYKFERTADGDFIEVFHSLGLAGHSVKNVFLAGNCITGYHQELKQVLTATADIRQNQRAIEWLYNSVEFGEKKYSMMKFEQNEVMLRGDVKNIEFTAMRTSLDEIYIPKSLPKTSWFKNAYFDLQIDEKLVTGSLIDVELREKKEFYDLIVLKSNEMNFKYIKRNEKDDYFDPDRYFFIEKGALTHMYNGPLSWFSCLENKQKVVTLACTHQQTSLKKDYKGNIVKHEDFERYTVIWYQWKATDPITKVVKQKFGCLYWDKSTKYESSVLEFEGNIVEFASEFSNGSFVHLIIELKEGKRILNIYKSDRTTKNLYKFIDKKKAAITKEKASELLNCPKNATFVREDSLLLISVLNTCDPHKGFVQLIILSKDGNVRIPFRSDKNNLDHVKLDLNSFSEACFFESSFVIFEKSSKTDLKQIWGYPEINLAPDNKIEFNVKFLELTEHTSTACFRNCKFFSILGKDQVKGFSYMVTYSMEKGFEPSSRIFDLAKFNNNLLDLRAHYYSDKRVILTATEMMKYYFRILDLTGPHLWIKGKNSVSGVQTLELTAFNRKRHKEVNFQMEVTFEEQSNNITTIFKSKIPYEKNKEYSLSNLVQVKGPVFDLNITDKNDPSCIERTQNRFSVSRVIKHTVEGQLFCVERIKNKYLFVLCQKKNKFGDLTIYNLESPNDAIKYVKLNDIQFDFFEIGHKPSPAIEQYFLFVFIKDDGGNNLVIFLIQLSKYNPILLRRYYSHDKKVYSENCVVLEVKDENKHTIITKASNELTIISLRFTLDTSTNPIRHTYIASTTKISHGKFLFYISWSFFYSIINK